MNVTVYAPGLTVEVFDKGPEPPSPPPPPASLTLVRKSPANTGVEFGGYNFFFNVAVCMGGGKIHHVWNGTWEFDSVAGTATKLTVTNSDGTVPTTRPENCGMVWVPGDGVYVSNGAPAGPSHKFDPLTNVKHMTGWALEGDTVLLHDAPRNRLLSVGGYTPPFDVRAYPLPSGPWATIATTNPPIATQDYAKLSMYRGGISSAGRVGFFGDGNALSELDGGAAAWVSRPTTGTLPPVYSHFVYYEPLDAYFAWCGANVVAGSNVPEVKKFYMLRRSTWTWEELAVTMPAGVPARSQAANILLADAELQQLVLMVAGGYVCMYTLDLRGLL